MQETSMPASPCAAALLNAKKSFPPVYRDKNNNRFGKKYASLDTLLAAVTKPLTDNDLLLTYNMHRDAEHWTCVGELEHTPTGRVRVARCPLVPDRNDMQGWVAAGTYGKRVVTELLLGITSEDDDDGNSTSPNNDPSKKEPVSSQPKTTTPAKGGPAAATTGITKPGLTACKTPQELASYIGGKLMERPITDANSLNWAKAIVAAEELATSRVKDGKWKIEELNGYQDVRDSISGHLKVVRARLDEQAAQMLPGPA